MSDLTLTLLVTSVYLVGIAAYGLWTGRRAGCSTEGFFLSGRNLGWFAIGMSIFATNISSIQFMSATGLAHRVGLVRWTPSVRQRIG